MKFDLKVWNKYRSQADLLACHINSYKDDNGIIHLEKEILHEYIGHITLILKECDDYIEKCGLTESKPLWEYNLKDSTTHPSSKSFLYKNCMSKRAIKNYGKEFMAE